MAETAGRNGRSVLRVFEWVRRWVWRWIWRRIIRRWGRLWWWGRWSQLVASRKKGHYSLNSRVKEEKL